MNRASVMSAIRRPQSAAIAGLVFAVILGLALALLHGAAPGTTDETRAWVNDDARRSAVNLALTLVPFAGIAFLWFIAVIRTHLGARDDRFFETVFLGSGLIFVAAMFTAAAALKAVLLLDASAAPPTPDIASFAWTFASAILGVFGAKMAAVFTFAAATAGVRAASLPRWLGILGYVTGLCLLFIPPLPNLAQFLFPLWVALVSLLILVRRNHLRPEAGTTP
jgi:hypothetical protein